jgi:ankyrin repeat protein
VQSESLLHAALTQDVPVVPGTKRDIVAVIKY